MYIWCKKCFCHEELSGFPLLKFQSFFFLLIEADETDDDDDSEDEGI